MIVRFIILNYSNLLYLLQKENIISEKMYTSKHIKTHLKITSFVIRISTLCKLFFQNCLIIIRNANLIFHIRAFKSIIWSINQPSNQIFNFLIKIIILSSYENKTVLFNSVEVWRQSWKIILQLCRHSS